VQLGLIELGLFSCESVFGDFALLLVGFLVAGFFRAIVGFALGWGAV